MTSAELYDQNPDGKLFAQGDVVDGVPFVWTPPKSRRWVLLRPLPTQPVTAPIGGLPRKFNAFLDGELQTAWNRPDGELIMAPGYARPAIILSQSCDLDHRKSVHIAPVLPITEVANDRTKENIRAGEVGYYYYLPPTGTFPESFADLTHITTIDPTYLRIDQLLIRLSAVGLTDFMNFLSDYFAKPFGFNTRDTVPQTSSYRCARCFFSGGATIQQLEMKENEPFSSCPSCGTNALWVKVIA